MKLTYIFYPPYYILRETTEIKYFFFFKKRIHKEVYETMDFNKMIKYIAKNYSEYKNVESRYKEK